MTRLTKAYLSRDRVSNGPNPPFDYKDAGKKKLAKSVTVGRNGDPIAVSLTQLSADGGTLYITQTSRGQPESAVAEIAYPGKG